MLNGGSSAGKSSLARCLQARLARPWLTFGVDSLIEAAPPALWGAPAGIVVASDGAIAVGPDFRELEQTWFAGLVAMARAGGRLILDEVFLDGAAAQAAWRQRLAGLRVLWVGVRCDPAVAAAREAARGDRLPGMALRQALAVHRGVTYDVEVDTTRIPPDACARIIAAHVEPPAEPPTRAGCMTRPD